MRFHRAWTLCTCAALAAGCNAILGIHELGVEVGADATVGSDASDGGGPESEAGCAPGMVLCARGCIALDAAIACGSCANDCTAKLVNVDSGSIGCYGDRCIYACAPGYADCADSGTGCATALSEVGHCGACATSCEGGTACAPQGDAGVADASTYGCVTTCPSNAPSLCNGQCVDEQTDIQNCGGCGQACPITCTSGVCLKAVAIAASSQGSGTCAVLSDGTVRCWPGSAFGGQLSTSSPATVPNVSGATKVAAGASNACAIAAGGAIDCWGQDLTGTISDGSVAAASVGGLTGALSVSANGHPMYDGFTCGLVPGGLVYCWGQDALGQLGTGSQIPGHLNPTLARIENVTDLSMFSLGGCAVVDGGTVSCWGDNGAGELGNGTAGGGPQTQTQQPTPTQIPGLTGATSISAGTFHVCARLADAGVSCWGSDSSGELGNGVSEPDAPTPTIVSNLGNVTAVSAGNTHTCALMSDGTVKCWGDNYFGELGNGTVSVTAPMYSLTPTTVVGITNVKQVAAGGSYTCALLASGAVECWGDNTYGELGNGVTSTNPQPTPALVKW